jgi:hypothetical protein
MPLDDPAATPTRGVPLTIIKILYVKHGDGTDPNAIRS